MRYVSGLRGSASRRRRNWNGEWLTTARRSARPPSARRAPARASGPSPPMPPLGASADTAAAPDALSHGWPRLPEARQAGGSTNSETAATRQAPGPASGQAAPGRSGAAEDRRQRRCPLHRRPDLLAAAEAVQPPVPGGGGGVRRLARRSAPFLPGPCWRPAGAVLLQPDAGGGDRDHLPADRAVLVPGAARLARPGAQTDVLGHDRGGRAPGGARSRRRAVGGLAGPGRAPAGLVHERGDLARARAGRRARGAGPQRGGGAGEVLQRERAQDQRPDPGAGRRAPCPRQHDRQGRRRP